MSSVSTSSSSAPVKRGPGRPRKQVSKEAPMRQGILGTPEVQDNIVEMLYDTPGTFKKIGTYFKSLKSSNLLFQFSPNGLLIYTNNYKESCDVGITFDGAKMNKYYCQEPITLSIAFDNLDHTFSKIDTSYETIGLVVTRSGQKKTLGIILNNSYNIPEDVQVDLQHDDKPREFGHPLDPLSVQCDLEFHLDSKFFKKMISDTASFNTQWTIEKYGAHGNLVFSYASENNQVRGNYAPAKPAEIGLTSTIKGDEVFAVRAIIEDLKPTSSAQLSDRIHIKASRQSATDDGDNKKLWIWAELDSKAVLINVFLRTVNTRMQTPK